VNVCLDDEVQEAAKYRSNVDAEEYRMNISEVWKKVASAQNAQAHAASIVRDQRHVAYAALMYGVAETSLPPHRCYETVHRQLRLIDFSNDDLHQRATDFLTKFGPRLSQTLLAASLTLSSRQTFTSLAVSFISAANYDGGGCGCGGV
jgi:predicted component of type VI protein secretion system